MFYFLQSSIFLWTLFLQNIAAVIVTCIHIKASLKYLLILENLCFDRHIRLKFAFLNFFLEQQFIRRNSLLPNRISGRKSSSKHFKRRVRAYYILNLIYYGKQETSSFNICGSLPVTVYLVQNIKLVICQLVSYIFLGSSYVVISLPLEDILHKIAKKFFIILMNKFSVSNAAH